MIRPRTVVLIGAISLAAGWMAGNISSPTTQEAPAQRRSSGPRPLGAGATSVAPYTAQLRQKLEEHPRTPLPGRNPFVFGSRRAPSSAPMSRAEARAVEPEERAMPAPPPPFQPFRLSGVAASEKDGAVVLTAILIDNGSMLFAKAGDKLSGGHSVLRVEEKAIVIVDGAGVEQIIRLP
ncbi:MAG: hypothetical protein Q7R30_11280 [Acidobacteriota bacterium]|nr:hypothetical protein [Acidobacteriota bacterium]